MSINFKLGNESLLWWIANIKMSRNGLWGADVPVLVNGKLVPDFLHVTAEMGDCGDGVDIKAYIRLELEEYANNFNPSTEVFVELSNTEHASFENMFWGYLVGKGIETSGNNHDWRAEYSIENKKRID